MNDGADQSKDALMSKKDQILDDELPQEPDAGPSSFFPETGPGLAKEVKIGLLRNIFWQVSDILNN